MKSKIIFVILLLIFAVDYSFGQTAKDFEKKYGAAKYYEIRPYTLVSPTFDKNGQICRTEIISSVHTLIKDKKEETEFVEAPISFNGRAKIAYQSADTERMFPLTILNSAILREVFDELVPVKTRKGKAVTSVDPSGFGQIKMSELKFENIVVSASVVLYEEAKINLGGFGENLDLFFNPPFGQISSARIVWTGRKCVEN